MAVFIEAPNALYLRCIVPIYRGTGKLEAITRAKGILQAICDAASSSRLLMESEDSTTVVQPDILVVCAPDKITDLTGKCSPAIFSEIVIRWQPILDKLKLDAAAPGEKVD